MLAIFKPYPPTDDKQNVISKEKEHPQNFAESIVNSYYVYDFAVISIYRSCMLLLLPAPTGSRQFLDNH